LVTVIAGAWLAHAGDLNPPAGPILPTMKTLDEVEPRIAINATNTPGDADSLFKITQPGSYYLTGNITGVAAKHGIEIEVGGVTLDLNGFDLVGIAGMGAFDGVSVTVPSLTNIAIVNGSVRNWGSNGVNLAMNFGGNHGSCTAVRASGNTGVGIGGSTVTNCMADNNTGAGIVGVAVTNCVAGGNTGGGIGGYTVTNCAAGGNTGYGIRLNVGGTATNCSASGNNGDGILVSTGGYPGGSGTITHCAARLNQGAGIRVGHGATISECSVGENTAGIIADTGCTVSNCSVYSNKGHASLSLGIGVGDGSTVAGCTVRENDIAGIVCTSQCVVRDNNCTDNGGLTPGGGAGIHVQGAGNTIQGNKCFGSGFGVGRGVDVDGAGNIIIKNTCSGNGTNWDIAANNLYGPIIDLTAPGSAAISGNSAPDSTGSTHPNANFTY
jgi:hypothetical protein